ncbi:MAG: T9SS type A sorting domain-containing protein [Bacteroidetes bacterium]|nr:T9SS type A sorting domain-containing protein [Bacteroidota bacterium]
MKLEEKKYENENIFLKKLDKEDIQHSNYMFKLYPNPASTQLTISYLLNSAEKGKLILYDILGREQMQVDLQNNINKVSVNIRNLPQGIYMYKFFVKNNQTENGKLLIE